MAAPLSDPGAWSGDGGISITPSFGYVGEQAGALGGPSGQQMQPEFGQAGVGGANSYADALGQLGQSFAGQTAPNPATGQFGNSLASDQSQLGGDQASQQANLQSLYNASQGIGPNPAAAAIQSGLAQQQAGSEALAHSGGFGGAAALAARQAQSTNATSAITAANTTAQTNATQQASALSQYSQAANQFAQQQQQATTAAQGFGIGSAQLQGTQNSENSQNMLAAQQQAQGIEQGQLTADTTTAAANQQAGYQTQQAAAGAAAAQNAAIVSGGLKAFGAFGSALTSDIRAKSDVTPAGGQSMQSPMMPRPYGPPMNAQGIGRALAQPQPGAAPMPAAAPPPRGAPFAPQIGGQMGGQMMPRQPLNAQGIGQMLGGGAPAAPPGLMAARADGAPGMSRPMLPGAAPGATPVAPAAGPMAARPMGGPMPGAAPIPTGPAAAPTSQMGLQGWTMPQQTRPAMNAGQIGQLMSDERAKDVRPGGETEADRFLQTMHPYSYKYKDPSLEPTDAPTGGRYLGVMAQNVERGPTGDTIVKETPRGKALEGRALMSAMAAGEGRLHERLSALEAEAAKNRKKVA